MSLDDNLLSVLRDNGRLPVSEISRKLDIPRHQIDERLKALTASGSLSFSAHVHPALLGIHSYSHVLIWTHGPTEAVTSTLSHMPNLPLVSAVAGEHDIAVEIGANNHSHLEAILEDIKSVPGVTAVRSSHHIRSFASRFNSSTGLTEADLPPLDPINKQLVEVLRQDGRAPYQRLSEKVGLSVGAVRSRLTKLIESGLLRVTCIPNWVDATRSFVVGIGLNTIGTAQTLQPLLDELRSHPSTEFGALTVGHFDVIATLSAPSLHELRRVLDRIKSHDSVSRLDSWMHLEIERESYELRDPFNRSPRKPRPTKR